MKPVPSTGSSGCELKAKAVEFLVLLHGLRHENLNPLIGCLAEPPRAALVSEYCARGSLQDVLQQDDIKLDWSFRLSLLTDLVRVGVFSFLNSQLLVLDTVVLAYITGLISLVLNRTCRAAEPGDKDESFGIHGPGGGSAAKPQERHCAG